MYKMKTKDNFEVSANDIQIYETYSSFLEGRKELMSLRIKSKITSILEEMIYSYEGVYIELPEGELPDYRICARLKSYSGVKDGDYSCLFACWFIENIDETVPNILKQAVSKIIWKDVAKDNFWEDL